MKASFVLLGVILAGGISQEAISNSVVDFSISKNSSNISFRYSGDSATFSVDGAFSCKFIPLASVSHSVWSKNIMELMGWSDAQTLSSCHKQGLGLVSWTVEEIVDGKRATSFHSILDDGYAEAAKELDVERIEQERKSLAELKAEKQYFNSLNENGKIKYFLKKINNDNNEFEKQLGIEQVLELPSLSGQQLKKITSIIYKGISVSSIQAKLLAKVIHYRQSNEQNLIVLLRDLDEVAVSSDQKYIALQILNRSNLFTDRLGKALISAVLSEIPVSSDQMQVIITLIESYPDHKELHRQISLSLGEIPVSSHMLKIAKAQIDSPSFTGQQQFWVIDAVYDDIPVVSHQKEALLMMLNKGVLDKRAKLHLLSRIEDLATMGSQRDIYKALLEKTL